MLVRNGDFVGERAALYERSMGAYPMARKEEVGFNMNMFQVKTGEKILEIGSGSGLYTEVLARLVTESGMVVATDPSADQLKNIPQDKYNNIRIVTAGAHQLLENSNLTNERNSFDGIWSLGAFHHCMNKSEAFNNFFALLKPKGRVFICDVFSGSGLARYFDLEVAKYSITGHEVAFLTEEFFDSLCFLFGFSAPKFHHLDYCWYFDTLQDLTQFMNNLHGLTNVTHQDALKALQKFLRIEEKEKKFILHVPLTIFETYKK